MTLINQKEDIMLMQSEFAMKIKGKYGTVYVAGSNQNLEEIWSKIEENEKDWIKEADTSWAEQSQTQFFL